MLISLAVLLVPAALIYAWFSRVPDEPEVAPANWQPVVAHAREAGEMTVLAPTALPETWKPIRARLAASELQLGFLSPDEVYHDVKQRPGASQPAFVRNVTREGVKEGSTTLSGREWTRYVSSDERTRCLVNVVEKPKPTTTVTCADAPYEAVEAFASTLA